MCAPPPPVILGPVPCSACRKPVILAHTSRKRDIRPRWRDANGRIHRCTQAKAA